MLFIQSFDFHQQNSLVNVTKKIHFRELNVFFADLCVISSGLLCADIRCQCTEGEAELKLLSSIIQSLFYLFFSRFLIRFLIMPRGKRGFFLLFYYIMNHFLIYQKTSWAGLNHKHEYQWHYALVLLFSTVESVVVLM